MLCLLVVDNIWIKKQAEKNIFLSPSLRSYPYILRTVFKNKLVNKYITKIHLSPEIENIIYNNNLN